MQRILSLICMVFIFISCNNNYITDLYTIWNEKEILFPQNMIFTKNINDTIVYNINKKIKIVNYIDSIGCLQCKSQFPSWKHFINDIDSLSNDKISTLLIVHPKKILDISFALKRDSFNLPICIDLNDEFNSLNHFPNNEAFNCFLLDENNHVVLIGNPVLNPKIKELYIRTICERLGIEQPTETSEPLRITNNLGVFDWRKEQQTTFVVRNSQNDDMSIDSLYSSCECTTATIDKTLIAKGDSAIVTVTYKAEKAEPFMREVYVHSANNQEFTLVIEGEGID